MIFQQRSPLGALATVSDAAISFSRKGITRVAAALTRSQLTRRNLFVVDIYCFIPKRELDDVRWEKVEQVRGLLIGETYPVPPEQIAARLIDQMLDHGLAYPRRRRSRSRGKTIQ
jgi:hypothetical protein